ncbi:MAG: hypothetical protein JJU40_07965 [Rhodobacteraceae bacterium]|nr:hypothetical protein [Paracoccaceae bacterium]
MTEETSSRVAPDCDLIARARALLHRVEEALREGADRLREEPEARQIQSILGTYHKALLTVIDMEDRIVSRQRNTEGAGPGRLDLEAARAEIGRRLACIRDARDAPGHP